MKKICKILFTRSIDGLRLLLTHSGKKKSPLAGIFRQTGLI